MRRKWRFNSGAAPRHRWALQGADYAIAAANNAEAAYAHDDVAAFLRIALELLAGQGSPTPKATCASGPGHDVDDFR